MAFAFFNRRTMESAPGNRRVLIFASCGIGDLILATPLFANIKRHFPGSTIMLVLRRDLPLEFRLLNPHIDETAHYPPGVLLSLVSKKIPATGFPAGMKMLARELLFLRSLRRRRFDMSFSLFPGGNGGEALLAYLAGARRRIGPQYREFGRIGRRFYTDRVVWNDASHVVENNLDLLRKIGLEPVTRALCLKPREADLREAAAFYRDQGVTDRDTLVGIHPGISGRRNYWPIDRVLEIVRYLCVKPDVKVAVFSGPDENAAVRRFDELPVIKIINQPFSMAIALIQRCSLVFTSDSMLGHAAAALNVPTVTVYGNGNHNKYGRWGVADFFINKLPVSDYPGFAADFFAGQKGKAAIESVGVDEVVVLFERALPAIGRR